MAIELVTGRAGTPHVGSEDVRAFQAYTSGSGRYVLHGGGATVQSANSIHVNPAELLIDGAHIRITGTGEDVTIENGASSYQRVDIIALHYKKTGDEGAAVETIELTVVKGTPASSSPQDPVMPVDNNILNNPTEAYIPYVRVLIDGLTPQTPTISIEDYAVVADKVKPGAVTSEGIADDAVTAEKIATDAVTSDGIKAGAVGSSELASNAVQTAKIASKAVTSDKLAQDVRNAITKRTQLYYSKNGTKSNFTLSQDLANFDIVEVVYSFDLRDNNIQSSVSFIPDVFNAPMLIAIDGWNSIVQLAKTIISFNGTNASLLTETFINFSENSATTVKAQSASERHIRVHAVYGLSSM